MDAAVVICLDRNKLVEQESGPPLKVFYEAEALRCARSWRRVGWDGNIYAAQYEGRTVSHGTVRALAALGVQLKMLDRVVFRRSFMDVVNALAWAESGGVPESRIIYSDLDICMERMPPLEFTESGHVALYHYVEENQRRLSPEFAYRMRRGKELGYLCHNTYFQAFDRTAGFQAAVIKAAHTEDYLGFFEDNVYYAPTDDDYFFEEGAYDFICACRGGEFDVIDLPCPGKDGFFRHEHITVENFRL